MELTNIKTDYTKWLIDIKNRIRSSQIKAAVTVNQELIKLYWSLGKDFADKQLESTWGKGFFDQVSRDLKSDFPDVKGFSPRNLRYTKKFYLFYSQSSEILQQAVAKLECNIFSIPWGHHVEIITKCKTAEEALFFVHKTIENGWSRSVLLNFLDTNLYESQGKSITNFSKILLDPMSDLAQQT